MFWVCSAQTFQGARILELNQPPLERILEFRLETLDELGDRVERRLVPRPWPASVPCRRSRHHDRNPPVDLTRPWVSVFLPGSFYRQKSPAPDKLNFYDRAGEPARAGEPQGKEGQAVAGQFHRPVAPVRGASFSAAGRPGAAGGGAGET